MATITAQTGSLDVTSIVSQLMTIERQPLTKIQTAITASNTKLSSLGKIQSLMASLQDAARALMRTDSFNPATATSSDPAVVTATAGAGAPLGSYSVSVTSLAQHQTTATQSTLANSTTVLGGGTLRLQMGNYDSGGGTFTADTTRPEVSITIAPGSTVADVRTAINTANAGVTATLVNDGTGVKLMIRSTESGAANGFQMLVTDDDGNNTDTAGLSALAFDPLATVGSGRNMMAPQLAKDAAYSVSGLPLTATKNRIDGVLEGLTLELKREGGDPVDVSVSIDNAAIRAKVDKFVAAYNELNKTLKNETNYDAASKTAGNLQGNRTVLMAQSQLRGIMQATMGAGTIPNLSSAGLELQRDGSIAVNESKWNNAVADPAKLKLLFGNSDGLVPGNVGFARRFDTLITQLLGVDGAITGAQETLRDRITDAQARQAALEVRLTDIEKRLLRTYTQLDSNLSAMTASSQYLTNFLNTSA